MNDESTDTLVERLREEALALHSAAWSNLAGGQETTINASLATEAADRLESYALLVERMRGALTEARGKVAWIKDHANKLRKGTDDWFDLVEFEAFAGTAIAIIDEALCSSSVGG